MSHINLVTLKSKYKDLIPSSANQEVFLKDLQDLKTKLGPLLSNHKNAFIISKNKRNALFYYLCLYYSLVENKILDKTVITGQTYIDQHFMNEEKDKTLYEEVRYNDIAFVSLSQYDYTNQYLENLIIELIEFRNNNNKITIISYDVVDLTNTQYLNQIAKLTTYFNNNKFPIINLTGTKEAFTKSTITKQNRRIR